jgi:hypothetical protein
MATLWPTMRRSFTLLGLAVPSLLIVGAGAVACAGWQPPWSKAPTIVAQAWQRQELLVEVGAASLGTPSVFFDAAGRPGVALADRGFYMGASSIALARQGDDGWRVEFPLTPSAWRVCARAGEGGTVVVTHGDLDGPLAAMAWDGVTTTPAEPGPCPRPSSSMREATHAAGAHQLELSRDGRTLWHAAPSDPCPALDAAPGQRIGAFNFTVDDAGHVAAALLEHPEGSQDQRGQLRLALCGEDDWTSSIVAENVRVTEVGLALDRAGRAHVAYVLDDGDSGRLTYAVPVDGEPAVLPGPAEHDPRVDPAIAACLRVHAQPLQTGDIEAYQQGDGFRCAVLERDPTSSQQARLRLDPRCDAGEAPACALAGSLHHYLMGDVSFVLELPTDDTTRFQSQWRGLRPKGFTEDLGEASRRYDRACELGDARACLHHAALLPSDDPRRLAQASLACGAGLPHGCALAVAASGLRPDEATLARAEPALRAACEAADAAACDDLGVVLHLRGDAAGARAALERACTAKLEPACQNLERL